MKQTRVAIAVALVLAAGSANAANGFDLTHQWTFEYSAGNGSSALGAEIVSYDANNDRLWVKPVSPKP